MISIRHKPLVSSLAAAALCASVAVAVPAGGQGGGVDQRPKLDVPYVPTPQPVVEEMLRLANIKKDDMVYDLGCGDGRIVITAAQKYGAKGVGVDIDPARIEDSNRNAKAAGVTERVKFHQKDLFEMDFSDANAVLLYLLPDINLRLRPKLLDTLKPGTRIVSHAFDMGDWKPDEERTPGGRKIYMWIVPAKVDGSWVWEGESGRMKATFTQSFQNMTGSVDTDGNALPFSDGKIVGDQIRFTVNDSGIAKTYEGRVVGNTIEGVIRSGDKETEWRATRGVKSA